MYILILCVLLYFIWRRLKLRSISEPPEISGKLPFIGHGHLFLANDAKVYKTIMKMSTECTEKGGVATIQIGLRTMYCITDPEDCLTISNLCLDKDYVYKVAKPLLGNGLVTANESIWKKHRRLLNPAFNQSVLNSFIGIFNDQARVLTDQFDEKVGKPFDHDHLLRLNNLQTICLTAVGLQGEQYSEQLNRYNELLPKALSLVNERFKKFWLHNDFLYNISQLKREHDAIFKEMKKLSNKFVKAKREEMERREQFSEKDKSVKFKPFMELILEITNEMGCFTDEEIIEETDNIIGAGHDTSASFLITAFTLLGSHYDIQNKIYNEIVDVLTPDTHRDLNKDDLTKLVYTEAVIKEIMRLYPILPVIGRLADKPIKLKNYTVKANSGCYLFIAGINRLSIWGPDPEEFRPERWLDNTSLPDPNYIGVFGLGRRSCIGKVYAMMSLKVTIAHIVRRYRIKSDANKMVLIWQMMTRPGDGNYITLEKR